MQTSNPSSYSPAPVEIDGRPILSCMAPWAAYRPTSVQATLNVVF